eukprot:904965-Pelagomonas_calceolata.AAC.3
MVSRAQRLLLSATAAQQIDECEWRIPLCLASQLSFRDFWPATCCFVRSGQPLLAIGMGLRGMVPCRALLSWVPVLAHATRAKVSEHHMGASAGTHNQG